MENGIGNSAATNYIIQRMKPWSKYNVQNSAF